MRQDEVYDVRHSRFHEAPVRSKMSWQEDVLGKVSAGECMDVKTMSQ